MNMFGSFLFFNPKGARGIGSSKSSRQSLGIIYLVVYRKFNSGMAIMKNWLWREAYLPEKLSFYVFLELEEINFLSF